MKIVADAHIPFIHEYFAGYGDLILIKGRDISPADLKDADLLLVRSVTNVNEKLLAQTQVKFVGSVTAGADHIDTKWLDENHIAWRVASGFNAPPVADYVVSVIAALKAQGLALKELRDQSKKRLRAAVIGVGHVGSLVVSKLKLLNFDVILCDPLRAELESDFSSTPLSEIDNVDLISIHVPLTKIGKYPTYHFIDKSFFHRQKESAILLNASRGLVINFNDLKQAGKHLNWCFDVWEREPHIDKEVLMQALIATPHIAGYSIQSKIRGINMIYRMICELKLLQQKSLSPVFMQDQTLAISKKNPQWHDILLEIFNPINVTAMMQNKLLTANDPALTFDEMRHEFNQRYEFAYTKINAPTISAEDRELVSKLGVKVL